MIINKANDDYLEFTGATNYYKVGFNIIATEGTVELSNNCNSFWFLNIICSYQSDLKNENFQVWKLKRIENNSFNITATDGNDIILVSQEIPYSDFKYDECELWLSNAIILLPSEY